MSIKLVIKSEKTGRVQEFELTPAGESKNYRKFKHGDWGSPKAGVKPPIVVVANIHMDACPELGLPGR